VQFSDQHATIEKFSGLLGGQPVSLTGSIDLTRRNTVEFDLALRGQKIPLARQPGLILRSDLDLKIVRTNGQPPSISGEMTLGKSLYLRELNLITAGKLDQPTRSPPYFEVKEPPFDQWTLNLKIHGDRFLRVRSPVFNGEISATLDLNGPLREPMALGEVRINSGTLLFPFGTLTVDYGSVSLTSADPHRPQLFITASGRSFGYDVHMEVAGYADDPRMQFTATPPLSSEEVLLMLTAGELPRQEFVFSSREKASRLAFYLGRDLLMRLGIGVETAERLTIRSGEDVSEEGNLTYHLEYNFTDRWAAFGEYDRFNAFNAGLKFRLYSK
jgi:translocation and assembly module TamB